MKTVGISILFLLLTRFAFGQFILNEESRKSFRPLDLAAFTKANRIEYAIYLYALPTIRGYREFEDLSIHSLVRQSGKWFKIIFYRQADHIRPLKAEIGQPIRYEATFLTQLQADSLLDSMRVDAAFQYTQQQFNQLKTTCFSTTTGQEIHSETFYFGGSMYLYRISGDKEDRLIYYTSDFLAQCEDDKERSKMLRPFYNAAYTLFRAMNRDQNIYR
ncbi:MAG: hypothetical protein INR69_14810 [Mucilaginibacter polytrichastri]|nr:hypothetical protein [Mucilaginibacter polytrichastri]